MRRVVVTGIGILSSIGNNKSEVLYSLKNLKSGISFSKKMHKLNMFSNVIGDIKLDKKKKIDKKIFKFMNLSTIYSYFAFLEALEDSKLSTKLYQKNSRVGLIAGSGNSSYSSQFLFYKSIYEKKKVHPYFAIQSLPSNITACLSTYFKIYGVSYSISSACTTSSHCICNAFDLIKYGKQDIVFAGSGEEISLESIYSFDIMRVLSKNYNNNPTKSSRAFDSKRDGFVISGGSGFLVLEELELAISRKANIYAEIFNYASVSDGFNVILPSSEGSVRCMKKAIKGIKKKIDYINVHATSTKIGDIVEYKSILKVFGKKYFPLISSTKSITGHSLGSSGVHEIIYTILMIKNNFIVPSVNIDKVDNSISTKNIVMKKIKKKIIFAMSNNFGFGGTNVSIIIKNFIL
ncbi:beta-ketoacyl synthase N-terminal-like domain-containing protein [Buchnera aphidicola (Ceratoglyphina bambusae)]|uniref:beta-ketoacyl synthase N-terminal-like domain-containing protein n=1 Tax=Buchnera aphidicola TaxID=9 RepID=UPI0031B84AED